MTPQEALNSFGLSLPVTKKRVQEQYAKLLRECNLRLNNASTIEKRKQAQEKLGELQKAKLLLEEMTQRSRRTRGTTARAHSSRKTTQATPMPTFQSQPTPRSRTSQASSRQPATAPTAWAWTYRQPTAQPANPSRQGPTNVGSHANKDFWTIVIAIMVLLLIISLARTTQSKGKQETQQATSIPDTQACPGKAAPLIPLEPADGFLVVETHPWSQVYLGLQCLGEAPSLREHAFRPGEYQIRLIFHNKQEVVIPVQIESGKRTLLKYNLLSNEAKIESF